MSIFEMMPIKINKLIAIATLRDAVWLLVNNKRIIYIRVPQKNPPIIPISILINRLSVVTFLKKAVNVGK